MKRRLWVLLLVACMLLCGCQKKTENEGPSAGGQSGETSANQPVQSPPDAVPPAESVDAPSGSEETEEERFVRIVKNYCFANYHVTESDGLNIRDAEYENGKCAILTYLPSNIGLKLFVSFTFDTDEKAETAVADYWGEETEFLLSEYDR